MTEREQRSRRKTAPLPKPDAPTEPSLAKSMEAAGFDVPHSLVGALTGLGNEIHELRLEIREQRIVTERQTVVLEMLTQELSALRQQRAGGGNGHAKDLSDELDEEHGQTDR